MARKTSTRTGGTADTTADLTADTTAVATRNEPGLEQSEHRSQILLEIVSIAQRLEDDGLELLLQQAKVVEYKGKIEKFNRRLHVAAHEAIEARRQAAAPAYRVHIERTNDDFFIIQLDDARVFFNLNELRALTRICHKAKDAAAAKRMLFRWFDQERSDLLADTGISSNQSPYLDKLYEVIVTTYKVRD